MSLTDDLLQRVLRCPAGTASWKMYEDASIELLQHLLVPPLQKPHIQPRTYSGIERRDAVFPNRNFGSDHAWGKLYRELDARMILFEFKNYDKMAVGKEEVNQVRNYLREPLGRLGIICCRSEPDNGAYVTRNTTYTADKKVILFLQDEQLEEMCNIKRRGEDPADLIMDLVELFYLRYE